MKFRGPQALLIGVNYFFATSRKIAIYIYRMLRWGQPYVDAGAEAQEKVYEIARLSYLKTFAASLGFQLVPKAANA